MTKANSSKRSVQPAAQLQLQACPVKSNAAADSPVGVKASNGMSQAVDRLSECVLEAQRLQSHKKLELAHQLGRRFVQVIVFAAVVIDIGPRLQNAVEEFIARVGLWRHLKAWWSSLTCPPACAAPASHAHPPASCDHQEQQALAAELRQVQSAGLFTLPGNTGSPRAANTTRSTLPSLPQPAATKLAQPTVFKRGPKLPDRSAIRRHVVSPPQPAAAKLALPAVLTKGPKLPQRSGLPRHAASLPQPAIMQLAGPLAAGVAQSTVPTRGSVLPSHAVCLAQPAIVQPAGSPAAGSAQPTIPNGSPTKDSKLPERPAVQAHELRRPQPAAVQLAAPLATSFVQPTMPTKSPQSPDRPAVRGHVIGPSQPPIMQLARPSAAGMSQPTVSKKGPKLPDRSAVRRHVASPPQPAISQPAGPSAAGYTHPTVLSKGPKLPERSAVRRRVCSAPQLAIKQLTGPSAAGFTQPAVSTKGPKLPHRSAVRRHAGRAAQPAINQLAEPSAAGFTQPTALNKGPQLPERSGMQRHVASQSQPAVMQLAAQSSHATLPTSNVKLPERSATPGRVVSFTSTAADAAEPVRPAVIAARRGCEGFAKGMERFGQRIERGCIWISLAIAVPPVLKLLGLVLIPTATKARGSKR